MTPYLDPAIQAALVELRRDIHAHPELSFAEHRTAGLIAERLRAWGIEVHTGIGETGVVGVIDGSVPGQTPGRSIGLRADMDALPIQEKNRFPHASTYAGKMHACGHDGHVAILMGAAHALAHDPSFSGRVVLIFQPAEEGGAGAQRMIEDGLFDRFPVDAVFAMHNWPGLAVGSFAVKTGPMMASSNEFHIKVRGKGAHAAMPHLGIDPILIAAQLVQSFQGIVARMRDPLAPAVLSVTKFHAGEAINAIPEFAELSGTVRTFDDDVLDLIENRLAAITRQICESYGASAEFVFERNYPALINDDSATRFAQSVLNELVGESQVFDQLDPTMGAEDFAFMLNAVPGSYLWIGNGEGGHRLAGHGLGPCMLHNPSYDFNDALLPFGVSAWVALARAWLAGKPAPSGDLQ
ncbi:MAG: M20 aminoacylase family protein [Burkholderiaceae bacterium]|jgi:amidohydrolase